MPGLKRRPPSARLPSNGAPLSQRGVFRVKPKRRPHTPQAIENIRASVRRHWENPATRARQSEIVRRCMASPEVRAKIADATRAGLARARAPQVPQ